MTGFTGDADAAVAFVVVFGTSAFADTAVADSSAANRCIRVVFIVMAIHEVSCAIKLSARYFKALLFEARLCAGFFDLVGLYGAVLPVPRHLYISGDVRGLRWDIHHADAIVQQGLNVLAGAGGGIMPPMIQSRFKVFHLRNLLCAVTALIEKRKIYRIDKGFLTARGFQVTDKTGALFENVATVALHKRQLEEHANCSSGTARAT